MKLHMVVEHRGKEYKFRVHHYSYAFPIWIAAILWLWLWLIPVGFLLFFSDIRDFYNDFRKKVIMRLRNFFSSESESSIDI
jgi:hypothetical protein